MKQAGRKYYNPSMSITVDTNVAKFELRPGFVTSILQHERDVMLCAEVSHKLMRRKSALLTMGQMMKGRSSDLRTDAVKPL